AQQNYADGLLAKWVAKFMRPLSIVEDPGLCEFYGFSRMGLLVSYETYLGSYNCKTTSSGLPLSSEPRICSGCRRICVTIDICTGGRAHSFIALTPHFADADFMLCNWTHAIEALSGIHTGVAIAACLNTMLKRWDLSPAM
ncbi:hypothetical protein GN958_ATG15369, partial [Phytophthora infestans]